MSDETQKKKKAPLRYSVHGDVNPLKEMIFVCPHDAPYGQTTIRWEEVTVHMREPHGDFVTTSGCRKRFDDLLSAFKKDNVKALRASGTEEEMEAAADKKKATKEDKEKKIDGDDTEREIATPAKKRKEEQLTSGANMELSNKIKVEEVAAKMEELALGQRKLELEHRRYLLEKAQREALFQLARTEREALLELMR
ncbi:hypothetical protein ACHHYP_13410 [Achlya hypogyna]|uniref:Uncharacterized protein n=1 Tax=Achlya hypogyna TaxID=1202772 RepID=A0A1V9YFC1_ACHHY|nr:hypothetical protein ACHHYP_13410 [Achlya hypogyna]